MSETHRWIGGISALFGAWVFVSAFVFGMAGAHYWNDLIVGAAIFILAGYSATQASTSTTGNAWASGLAALLGLWTIATPFVYGAATASMWSGVVSGIVVAVLSGYNAYAAWESTGSSTATTTGA
ncbi:MAG: SPW repeat protein [Haloarculaceae archaeon]